MLARLRRWRRLTALVGALALCLPPHLLMKALGLRSPLPPSFLGLAARAVGARVRVEGAPLRTDVFFISNHVSWVDILALGGASRAAFISKDDVARWPIVGWLARQNNTIFIARADRRGVTDQVNELRRALEGHQPVALFAEGTTGDGQTLLPFKPALLAGIMPPPRALRVQPVFIDYGEAASEIAWSDNEGAGANATRLLARKGPLDISLHFLEPFDPADYADRKAVAAEARKRIENCLPPSAGAAAAV